MGRSGGVLGERDDEAVARGGRLPVPGVAAPGLRHHDLRRDVGAGRRHRRDQPRAGLPRHRRAARGARRRRRRHPRRPQPVPARDRHPRAAPRDRRAPGASGTACGTTPTPRCSSPRAPPRRSPRRCSRCASRATRSSPSSRTTTRTRRASRWPARTGRVVHAAAARLRRSTPTRSQRAVTPRTRAAPAQLAAQPDRQGLQRRRARAHRRSCASSTTSSRSPTRSTSTSCSTGEHVPLATLPGHARAHGHDLVGRARRSRSPGGRSAGCARRPTCVAAVAHGEAVPHLRERRAVPVRRSRSGCGLPGVDVPPARRRPARRSATACPPGWPPPGFTVLPSGRAPTSSPPTSARSARPTASRSAGRCPSAAAWSRCRASCSTTTRTPVDRWCGSRSASGSRSSTTRRPGCGDWPGEGRRRPARHRVGGPRRELRAPRADDRRRRGRRRPAGRAHRDVLDRLLDGRTERVAEPFDGPSAQFLVEQAASTGVWVCGSVPEVQPGDDAAVQHVDPRRARRREPSGTARSTRSRYGGEHEQYAAGDAHLTVDVEGVRVQPLRLLRPALRRRVLGPRARHRLLRRRRQLARAAGATTGGRCCGPGRSRTRPTWSA